MRTLVTAAIMAAVFGGTADALPLNWMGVSYTLFEAPTANPLVDRFFLEINGINGPLDSEGGRSGVNAIALNKPNNLVTATMVAPPAGYTYVVGGLDSGGCDGNGNFYCFDNTAIPPTPASAFAAGTHLEFIWDVLTSAVGSFANYTTAFKIDWVGTQNNYDLVSLPIDISPLCVGCTPGPTGTPVNEPGTLALIGTAILGLVSLRLSKWRRHSGGVFA
jgi:hypothetical protein